MCVLVFGIDGERQAFDRREVEVCQMSAADLQFFDMLLLLLGAGDVDGIKLIDQITDRS